MIFDIHVHTIGEHPGNFLSPQLLQSVAFRLFAFRFGLGFSSQYASANFGRIERRTKDYLDASTVSGAVVLALDAPYQLDGTKDLHAMRFVVANDYVADLAETSSKIHFGASVHPYRRDAIQELERLIKRGACLIKWLPSAQNIQPQNPRCFEFYEALAHYNLPLLCHTGREHILNLFPDDLNRPLNLIPALKRGVTVIAAHCGARLFANDISHFAEWCDMARRYESFYGDLSAFITFNRLGPLKTILTEKLLTDKVVFGSDFPALHFPLQYITTIGTAAAFTLQFVKNPFEQAVRTLQLVGVPESVFARGQTLTKRLPMAPVA